MKDADRLDEEVRALLADARHGGHPLRDALERLHQAYREQREQVARLTWISDRYQTAVMQENRLLSARNEQQQRRLAKIARISDRYQEMQRELARDLRNSATHDALTGLPNRRLMLEELQAAEHRRDSGFSLALLDVDHFKQINDAHGHDAGDQVLVRIAAMLRGQLRTDDICARWGGEEFLLLWPGVGIDAAVEIAERIRLAIERTPFEVQGRTMRLTVSIGVATHRAGRDSTDLIKRADFALYEAKHGGRNRTLAADRLALSSPPAAQSA